MIRAEGVRASCLLFPKSQNNASTQLAQFQVHDSGTKQAYCLGNLPARRSESGGCARSF